MGPGLKLMVRREGGGKLPATLRVVGHVSRAQ